MYEWADPEADPQPSKVWGPWRLRAARVGPVAKAELVVHRGTLLTCAFFVALAFNRLALDGRSGGAAPLVALGAGLLCYAGLVVPQALGAVAARRLDLEVHRLAFTWSGLRTVTHDHAIRVATQVGLGATILVVAAGQVVTLIGVHALLPVGGTSTFLVGWMLAGAGISLLFACLPTPPFAAGRLLHAALWSVSGRRLGSWRASVWIGRVVVVCTAVWVLMDALYFARCRCAPLQIPLLEWAGMPRLLLMGALVTLATFAWHVSHIDMLQIRLERLLEPHGVARLTRPAIHLDDSLSVAHALARLREAGVDHAIVACGDGSVKVAAARDLARLADPREPLQSHASRVEPDHHVGHDLPGNQLVGIARCRVAQNYLAVRPDGVAAGVVTWMDVDSAFREAWHRVAG